MKLLQLMGMKAKPDRIHDVAQRVQTSDWPCRNLTVSI